MRVKNLRVGVSEFFQNKLIVFLWTSFCSFYIGTFFNRPGQCRCQPQKACNYEDKTQDTINIMYVWIILWSFSERLLTWLQQQRLMAYSHCTGTSPEHWTSTIGDNGSWFLYLPGTSVNTSVQYTRTHCYPVPFPVPVPVPVPYNVNKP